MTHELKTHPEPFAAIISGSKRYEIRSTCDRSFLVGDTLRLREFDPTNERYTGFFLDVRVTHLTRGGEWGLPITLCVMGIEPEHPSFLRG